MRSNSGDVPGPRVPFSALKNTKDPSFMSVRRLDERQEVDAKEQRVYKAWVNWKLGLREGNRKVGENIVNDLADGVALCQLATVLLNLTPPPRFNANPMIVPQMIDNASVAMKLFTDAGLSSSFDAKIFSQKEQRLVLGFLWQLIENDMVVSRRAIVKARKASQAGMEAESEMSVRKEIYEWTQRYLQGYPAVPDLVALGPRAFRDGRVLSLMLHKAQPQAISLAEMEMRSPPDRINAALLGAKKALDVPLLLTADLIMDADATDRVLLTYLFAFRECVEQHPPPVQRTAATTATTTVTTSTSPTSAAKTAPVATATKGRGTTIRGDPSKTNRAGLESVAAGPEHEKFTCPICSNALTGLLVKVLPDETLYHNHCFVCKTCKKSFDQFYWPFQLIPYCFEHYLDAAGLVCVQCNKPIRDNAVTVRGAKYHSRCFVCTTCKKEFAQSYNIFESRPYCDEHYKAVAGTTCTSCGLDIDDQAIKAISGLWHKRCFACCRCATPILRADGKALPFFAMEGQPVCLECHEKMTDGAPDTCAKCQKDIKSGIVSAMAKKWCSSCFTCTKCAKALHQSFFNVGGAPYCESCAGTV